MERTIHEIIDQYKTVDHFKAAYERKGYYK